VEEKKSALHKQPEKENKDRRAVIRS